VKRKIEWGDRGKEAEYKVKNERKRYEE